VAAPKATHLASQSSHQHGFSEASPRKPLQLIDASADKHLWARSFERDSRDVLALQDELASAIAREINVQLTPGEQARLANAPVVNPAEHDAYVKGRYFVSRMSDENFKKALAQFRQSIKIDPNFALPCTGLADAYCWADDLYSSLCVANC
jgi:hypothetical protein